MLMGFIHKNYNKKYIKYIDELFYPSLSNEKSLKNTLVKSFNKGRNLNSADIMWIMKDCEVPDHHTHTDYDGSGKDTSFDSLILPHCNPDKELYTPFISVAIQVDFNSKDRCWMSLVGSNVFAGLTIQQKIFSNEPPIFIIEPRNSSTGHLVHLKESLISSGQYIYKGENFEALHE